LSHGAAPFALPEDIRADILAIDGLKLLSGQRLEFHDLCRSATQVLLVLAPVPPEPSDRRKECGQRALQEANRELIGGPAA